MGCIPSKKAEVEPEQNGQLLLKADKAQRLEAAKKRQEKLNEQHKKATLAAAGITKTAIEQKEKLSTGRQSMHSSTEQRPAANGSVAAAMTPPNNNTTTGNDQSMKLHKDESSEANGISKANNERPHFTADGEPYSEKFEEHNRTLSGVSEERAETKESETEQQVAAIAKEEGIVVEETVPIVADTDKLSAHQEQSPGVVVATLAPTTGVNETSSSSPTPATPEQTEHTSVAT